MTEEIIIDGVNVAGCVRLQDDKISCDLGGECKGWENCYYKQLKRAEIEIEKLKGVDGSIHPDSAYYKITRLEQERDAWHNEYDKAFASKLECFKALEVIKQENERLKKKGVIANGFLCDCEENDKYKSALEEINLILDELKQQYDYMSDYAEIKEIQDKIDEVLQ